MRNIRGNLEQSLRNSTTFLFFIFWQFNLSQLALCYPTMYVRSSIYDLVLAYIYKNLRNTDCFCARGTIWLSATAISSENPCIKMLDYFCEYMQSVFKLYMLLHVYQAHRHARVLDTR